MKKLVVFCSLLGCTNTEMVAPQARTALMQSTIADTVRVPTANGGVAEFGPNATLYINGEEVLAGEVYWNEQGIFRKNGDFMTTWDGIDFVKVEQIDRRSDRGRHGRRCSGRGWARRHPQGRTKQRRRIAERLRRFGQRRAEIASVSLGSESTNAG